MPLTGELTDLSLAELIEFFCNQRKDGRLEVVSDDGAGHFYLSAGAVVHAEIGVLRGIEAIHYTLMLPNASFTFASGVDAPEQTIDQSWQSVVLEGLRLMDEGVKPPNAFPEKNGARKNGAKGNGAKKKVAVPVEPQVEEIPSSHADESAQQLTTVGGISIGRASVKADRAAAVPSFLIEAENNRSVYGPWKLAAVLMAMILVLAVISVPWGWYARNKAARLSNDAINTQSKSTQPAPAASESVNPPANMAQPSSTISTSAEQPVKTEPGAPERAKDKK
jgi:hypothetical protein